MKERNHIMAFDGITVAAVTRELSAALTGGRITKIAQPEADEQIGRASCRERVF